jgi:hypothetical protein
MLSSCEWRVGVEFLAERNGDLVGGSWRWREGEGEGRPEGCRRWFFSLPRVQPDTTKGRGSYSARGCREGGTEQIPPLGRFVGRRRKKNKKERGREC